MDCMPTPWTSYDTAFSHHAHRPLVGPPLSTLYPVFPAQRFASRTLPLALYRSRVALLSTQVTVVYRLTPCPLPPAPHRAGKVILERACVIDVSEDGTEEDPCESDSDDY